VDLEVRECIEFTLLTYLTEVVDMMGKSNISYKAQENCKKLDSYPTKEELEEEKVE